MPSVPSIVGPTRIGAQQAERILRGLPQWFGIEEALVAYASEAQRLPNFAAVDADGVVGFVTMREHNAHTVEISCIAVAPARHRSGIGRALCEAVERWWASRGGRLVQVKTLGPSHPDSHYADTRAFYDALGFLPVEELQGLWPGLPCLLLVKPLDPQH